MIKTFKEIVWKPSNHRVGTYSGEVRDGRTLFFSLFREPKGTGWRYSITGCDRSRIHANYANAENEQDAERIFNNAYRIFVLKSNTKDKT